MHRTPITRLLLLVAAEVSAKSISTNQIWFDRVRNVPRAVSGSGEMVRLSALGQVQTGGNEIFQGRRWCKESIIVCVAGATSAGYIGKYYRIRGRNKLETINAKGRVTVGTQVKELRV